MIIQFLFTAFVGFACGILTYHIGKRLASKRLPPPKRRLPELNAEIEKILQAFKMDTDKMIRLQKVIHEELSRGLSSATHSVADVKMFPSYVRHLPMGNERGDVLALDLGGTNFRVLRITLLGGNKRPIVNSKVFVVPRSVMQGPGDMLFDHLADSLHKFMKSEDLLEQDLSLGFTFSFPCTQFGLASARLTTWTKGFTCSGVVGEDVVALLQSAIDKKGLKVKVTALINDTVGTLVACSYGEPHTAVGLIVGTGFNACYVEDLNRVGTWDGDYQDPKQVIINTEWGALGSNGCLDWLLTPFDREVDKSSVNPGHQIFEKLVSGMYMGEIVRNVLLDLVERRLLFIGAVEEYKIYAAPLVTPGGFLAKYVSDIETDDGIDFAKTAAVLHLVGIPHATFEDCAIIQYVCKLVSRRAGALTAVGLACLIERITDTTNDLTAYHNKVVIGVDGSVYRHHPKFHKNIMKPLNALIGTKVKYSLKLSDDGSGIGAALVAHMDALYGGQKGSRQESPTEKVHFVLGNP